MQKRNRSKIYVMALLLATVFFVATSLVASADVARQDGVDGQTGEGLDKIEGVEASLSGGALIDNGTIMLGVHQEGHLIIPGPASPAGNPFVGLRYLPTNNEVLGLGRLSEGWGVADGISGFSGWANEGWGGTSNLTPISFLSTSTTAESVVHMVDPGLQPIFRVTHDYHPSLVTPYLYEVLVTIENISGADTDVLYRRVMDWDAEPTQFSEYVTIQGTALSPDVAFASDDGFASADPFAGPTWINFTGDDVDNGPIDHGALFDFDLGSLGDGESVTFTIYYGASSNEADALNALVAVGADVYSLAQPSSPHGANLGVPNTFILGYSGTQDAFLWIDPPASYVARGELATVDVMIRDVTDLYGIELNLLFDPSLVEVVDTNPAAPGVQITPGVCPAADFIALNDADNTHGAIQYDVSSVAPTLPCDGGGVVASITFRGLATGSSPIHFPPGGPPPLLVDSNGMPIRVNGQSGILTVLAGGLLHGFVEMQGRTNHGGALVCAIATAPHPCTTTNASGYYAIPGLGGTYDVNVEMERYLDGEQAGVAVPPATAKSLPPLFLLGGDCDDNDIVNILDLSFMGARYGLWWFDVGWDDKADINDDGKINIQDIVLGGSNYLQTSPVPWP